MKKLLLVLLCGFCLSACGNSGDSSPSISPKGTKIEKSEFVSEAKGYKYEKETRPIVWENVKITGKYTEDKKYEDSKFTYLNESIVYDGFANYTYQSGEIICTQYNSISVSRKVGGEDNVRENEKELANQALLDNPFFMYGFYHIGTFVNGLDDSYIEKLINDLGGFTYYKNPLEAGLGFNKEDSQFKAICDFDEEGLISEIQYVSTIKGRNSIEKANDASYVRNVTYSVTLEY